MMGTPTPSGNGVMPFQPTKNGTAVMLPRVSPLARTSDPPLFASRAPERATWMMLHTLPVGAGTIVFVSCDPRVETG